MNPYIEIDRKEDAEFFRRMKPTLNELQLIYIRRWYGSYRDKYFRGKGLLDVEQVSIIFVEIAKTPTGEGMQCLGMYMPSQCPSLATIALARGMDNGQAMTTLLHEMAHMSVENKYPKRNLGHGKIWQKEMLRLARAGAFDRLW